MKQKQSIETLLKTYEEQVWINPMKKNYSAAIAEIQHQFPDLPTLEDIESADRRLRRFAPVFMSLFPETVETNGIIESELKDILTFQRSLITFIGGSILGSWDAKLDSHLPIAGSVKARGGVYEIICFAESLALEAGLITCDISEGVEYYSDYSVLTSEAAQALFSQYTLIVGSTGNLGLSIGISGKALGFHVIVHMSHDAKPWKINLLREKGAEVVLHSSDYSKAVEEGRKIAEGNTNAYFIDDENSRLLFTGYAVAALRLKEQIELSEIAVDEAHPLFVYLPCGVGGAPGGIAYGLKCLYQDHVRIFFAEPTHAPCMLLGMATQKHDAISTFDMGLDTLTEADGLAVGRASGFVGKVMTPLIDGIYTVSDDKLLWMVFMLSLSEQIKLEPSALAGFAGPIQLFYSQNGFHYLKEAGLLEHMRDAHHISWATGGGLVPEEVMQDFIKRGESIKIEF